MFDLFRCRHWLMERIEVGMGKWNGIQAWSREWFGIYWWRRFLWNGINLCDQLKY
ncbi:hypothetical protein O9929_07685 [Vibrio lentus]|nr:hypothetical protein [Vibrio lentus]